MRFRGKTVIRLDQARVIRLEEVYGPIALNIEAHPTGLRVTGWREPWPWPELDALWWTTQERESLAHQVDQLRSELRDARAQLQAAEHACSYYRRQLDLESRYGPILARIMAR